MRLFALMTAFALFTVACGPETDLETAFCDQLAGEADRSVQASLEAEGAPGVARDATAYRISLVPDGVDEGVFVGKVAFKPDEKGDFAIGLSRDIPMRVVNGAGEEVTFKKTVVGASCPELAVRHTMRLNTNTYTIEFGPTDVAEVSLVSEESNDDL